jgi:excisionase family DNA binding protein
MNEQRDWIVDVRVSYRVEAASPDQALGAVLPLLSLGRERYGPQPEVADYTVRERPTAPAAVNSAYGEPAAHELSKPIYTAAEVAEILGVGKATVYQRLPSIRIGGTVRFARATLQHILEHGLDEKPPESPKPATRDY